VLLELPVPWAWVERVLTRKSVTPWVFPYWPLPPRSHQAKETKERVPGSFLTEALVPSLHGEKLPEPLALSTGVASAPGMQTSPGCPAPGSCYITFLLCKEKEANLLGSELPCP
jgi:hypothetical protein